MADAVVGRDGRQLAAADVGDAGLGGVESFGDARARLRRLSAIAASSDEPLRIDLAVRDWARREQTVAKRLRRVDNRRMDYLRSLFGAFCPDEDDIEARCMLFYALWIGSHFMVADHSPRLALLVRRRVPRPRTSLPGLPHRVSGPLRPLLALVSRADD